MRREMASMFLSERGFVPRSMANQGHVCFSSRQSDESHYVYYIQELVHGGINEQYRNPYDLVFSKTQYLLKNFTFFRRGQRLNKTKQKNLAAAW